MKEKAESIKPYDLSRPKSEQVEQMFDSIAPAYDFMNTAMTFGLHHHWRSAALKAAEKEVKQRHSYSGYPAIIDLATGTGDVAFALAKIFPNSAILGIDLSEGMLQIARQKNSFQNLKFESGDCLDIKYPDDTFNLLTIAYGVRNLEDLQRGFREFYRVLRHGGVCLIIELSRPENPIIRLGYDLYSRGLIPMIGRIVSKDPRAYTYLPESIKAMPPRSRIAEMLKEAGFANVSFRSMTLGVVTYYIAVK